MITDLIIPAKNEEPNISAVAEALRPLLNQGLLRRVILADNGSTDATARLASEAGFTVVAEPRPGYGNACLAGLASAGADAEGAPDAVGFLDADLADDPAVIPELISPLAADEADLVIGSRRQGAEPGALDPHQVFGNRLACGVMRLGCGRAYADMGPLRFITWPALQRLDMRDPTWGWTMEMQWKAATRGLRVREIEVPYRKRRAGKSKISGSLVGSFRAGTKILAIAAVLAAREARGSS